MKRNKIFSNKYFRYGAFIIGGIFLGWLFFHSSGKTKDNNETIKQSEQATIWTCAMHPQIRLSEPGKCPICGMDLIPLNQNNVDTDPAVIHLSKEAAELANVMTSLVTKEKPMKEVRLYGKVQADERLIQSQAAHFPGRIEKLMVNFTGESVKSGQALAMLYSPELITAQQELLEAAKVKQFQPEIFEASKEKLRQWKLSEDQIASIESSGIITNNFEVVSNTSGIVTARFVNNGDHIGAGTILFEVADLSTVWILFDAYESDLQFLKPGDVVDFTVQALPGVNFSGKIEFIDPVIDPVTRVAKVRLETNNSSGRLKPEMFVTGVVKARLDEYRNALVIPKSAVLWTGTRSIVYVKQVNTDEPVFKMREVGLGPMLGNSYVITDGLKEGEEIVTQGAFSVDAAAQLEGKPSMMNPQGSIASSMPGMVMPGDNVKSTDDSKNEHAGHNPPSAVADEMKPSLIKEIVISYIQLKNALADDNTIEAAKSGTKLDAFLKDFDKSVLTEVQKKTFEDIEADAREHAGHIGANGGNIEHQREHFILLSNDIYDLVKTFGGGQILFRVFDSMVNNGKGAFWLSETKEIKNPYMGKAMLNSGTVKEEIK